MIPKKYIVVMIFMYSIMLASLVYGFFLLKEDQEKNCWSKYSTEYEAIQNCENHDK